MINNNLKMINRQQLHIRRFPDMFVKAEGRIMLMI